MKATNKQVYTYEVVNGKVKGAKQYNALTAFVTKLNSKGIVPNNAITSEVKEGVLIVTNTITW